MRVITQIPSWRELWFRAVGVGYMEYRQLRRWWRRRRFAVRLSRRLRKAEEDQLTQITIPSAASEKAFQDMLTFRPGQVITVNPRDIPLFGREGPFTDGAGNPIIFINHANQTAAGRTMLRLRLKSEYLRKTGRLDPSDD